MMMTFPIVYPHIEKQEGQSARLQRLPRIRVAQIVMDYLAYGWSVEEICRQHPYLRPSEAYAAMGYYFDYQQEIDTEIRAEWEQALQEKAQAQAHHLLCGCVQENFCNWQFGYIWMFMCHKPSPNSFVGVV